jgi:hypothetical protein
MEKQFIAFLNKLVLKENVNEVIDKTEDNDLKKLMVCVADDYIIKYNKEWVNSLYEFKIFKTSNGGEWFFQQLEKYKEKKNLQMIRLYLISLSFGFRGELENIEWNFYKEYLEVLDLKFFEEQYKNPRFIPKEKIVNQKSFMVLLIPIVFFVIFIILTDVYVIKSLKNNIFQITNLIKGHLQQ